MAIPGLREVEIAYVMSWARETKVRAFAIMEQSKIVAMALIHLVDFNPINPDRQAPWVIDFIVTHPDYRRRGLAMTLVAEVKRNTSDLVAFTSNKASDELFSKSGFTESGYMTYSWNDSK